MVNWAGCEKDNNIEFCELTIFVFMLLSQDIINHLKAVLIFLILFVIFILEFSVKERASVYKKNILLFALLYIMVGAGCSTV